MAAVNSTAQLCIVIDNPSYITPFTKIFKIVVKSIVMIMLEVDGGTEWKVAMVGSEGELRHFYEKHSSI